MADTKINCFKCGKEMKLEKELPGMKIFICDECKTAKRIDTSKGTEKANKGSEKL